MTNYPREPHPGDRISATLIRDIIRCLRAITPRPGPGARMRFTPNGTFIDGLGGAAGGGGGTFVDNGCWKIVTPEGETVPTLANGYYQIGGTLCEFPAEDMPTLDEFVMQGELAPGEEYTEDDHPFIALVVDMTPDDYGSASVTGCKSFAEMQADATDTSKYVRPLYKLTHDGGVAIDFRNMPTLAAGETEVP